MADKSDPLAALRTGLELGSTVSMAIPPPVGPFVMVGLQVLPMLLPVPPPPKDPFAKVIKAILGLPDLIIDEAVLKDANSRISALTKGINAVLDEVHEAKGQAYELDLIIRAEADLAPVLAIANDLTVALENLLQVKPTGTDDVSGHRLCKAALVTYMALLDQWAIALKVDVELATAKVHYFMQRRSDGLDVSEDDLNEAINNVYVNFVELRSRMESYASDGCDARKSVMDLVGILRKQRSDILQLKVDGTNNKYNNDPHVHWISDKLADTTRINVCTDKVTEGWEAHQYSTITIYMYDCCIAQATAYLEGVDGKASDASSYRYRVLQDFDKDMDFISTQFADIWNQIKQVSDLPPREPSMGPTAEWKPCPEGYYDIPAEQFVAWGVQFVAGTQESSIVWSDWYKIPDAKSVPMLNVPRDTAAPDPAKTLAPTKSRAIYRIVSPTAQPPLRLAPCSRDALQKGAGFVVKLLDNTTERVCDIKYAKGLELTPIAQQAPQPVPPATAPGQTSAPYHYPEAGPGDDGAHHLSVRFMRPDAAAFPYCLGAETPLVAPRSGDVWTILAPDDRCEPALLKRASTEEHGTPFTLSEKVDGSRWWQFTIP